MMDILIVAQFRGNEKSRFDFLAGLLSESTNIEIVTSDFSHLEKSKKESQLVVTRYKITMLHEPGYLKNVSLKRIYSHYIFSRNVSKYLVSRKKPDVIYCAVPSLDVASAVVAYAKKTKTRLLIDIQDLWPEAFKMVFNIPILSDALFYPMKKKADSVYRYADEIVAVSQTYVERAMKVRYGQKKGISVFLGKDLTEFDELAQKNRVAKKLENEIWLSYVGTLSYSYDICCVIDALKIVGDKGQNNIKFIVMGEGPLRKKFEEYAMEKGVCAEFTGWLSYGRVVGLLASSDIAVNPITHNSAATIINKHADYALAGLPVINTQESAEYRELLERYNAGFNCTNNDCIDIAKAILLLSNDNALRHSMSANSRKMAVDMFDRSKTYGEIINTIYKD